MDTEADTLKDSNNATQNPTDLVALIQDLKYEFVTIITKTQALFQQQMLCTMTNKHPSSSVT